MLVFPSRPRFLAAVCLSGFALVACPQAAEQEQDTADVASHTDASNLSDASDPVVRDASALPGASVLPDASVLRDASVLPDASVPPDASIVPTQCAGELLGWASVAGDGVTTTTGGGTAASVRPTTAAELIAYASDASARVIEIAGTFDVPSLQINANKTLVGIGRNATIRGGLRIRGRADALVRNVIVRNLRIDGATTAVDDDAVQLYFAHHVWIDHCEIFDGPDGNLDMTHAVNWITVSWTKFFYTEHYQRPAGESADHRFSSLLGHSDGNASEDEGRLKITFHHNWWAARVLERMPRVRFGQVHVLNNLFASPGNNYCVRAGRGARLLVEANYFDGVSRPHEFNSATDQMSAHITARANAYHETDGARSEGGGGVPFTNAPYAVSVDLAADVPARVRACAGPR